jgi:hypothetical protein
VNSTLCNATKYLMWREERYQGQLQNDPNFWRYQTQAQFVLTNDLALQIAYGLCRHNMKSLIEFKAGRLGPVDDQTTYDIMCANYCLENDIIHEEAMDISGCSCLELSTQPGEDSYTYLGDWCRHNTGRMECDLLGFCGVWECKIDDFMCPRYEYNKRTIEFRGPGHCTSSSARLRVGGAAFTVLVSCVIMLLV